MTKEVNQQEYLVLTKEQFKEKYPTMSDSDIDFYFPEKKILDFSIDFVGVRRYDQLKAKIKEYNNYNVINPDKPKKTLSEFELNQIKSFESKSQQNKEQNFKNEVDHWEKIHGDNSKKSSYNDGLLPDKKTIYKNFLIAYKFLNGFEFERTEESIKNIEPIIKYFAYDTTFFDSENSIKEVGNKKLTPSFKKGLLLIGNVGNGKTSVMKAIQFMFDYYFEKAISEKWDTSGDWNRLKFKFKTCENLVTEYEFLKSGQEKEIFYSKYSKGNLFLDDMKREKNASNFGITNVVQSILEKRYNNQKQYSEEKINKVRTFGTMNFHENYPNNIDFAIQECGVRYGSHIYDRIFEMFNVVEFKGKSFRK
ncbi:hypothetical protein [Flavobacterium sp.]|uniref:hypothetical protein n=1 Tax=Flavobacterium sp. TaxID=239 RepID=UPI002633AB89|nr:hypothetical protein [Flavobacterium sp.]